MTSLYDITETRNLGTYLYELTIQTYMTYDERFISYSVRYKFGRHTLQVDSVLPMTSTGVEGKVTQV